MNWLRYLFYLLVGLAIHVVIASDNQTISTTKVDAVAKATQIGGGGIYPRFQSDLDDMSNREYSPRFQNGVGQSPVGNAKAIHAFYVKNDGGGVMKRKCTLSGQLAKKTDGTYSDRLVLDFWKSGVPLPVNQLITARKAVPERRDHDDHDDDDEHHHHGGHDNDDEHHHDGHNDDDDDDDHHNGGNTNGVGNSPLQYRFVNVNKDLKQGTATYELRYEIPSKKQINLSLACYSEQQEKLMAVKFTCTGDDRGNPNPDVYFEDDFFCNVGKPANNPVKPPPVSDKPFTVGGKIRAKKNVALTVSINGENKRISNQSADRRYTLGEYKSGTYFIRIFGQPRKMLCQFDSSGTSSTTIILNKDTATLSDIVCKSTNASKPVKPQPMKFSDSFESQP